MRCPPFAFLGPIEEKKECYERWANRAKSIGFFAFFFVSLFRPPHPHNQMTRAAQGPDRLEPDVLVQ